jgi:hypothetical protein
LFNNKEGENFNHRNTLSILRINPPKFGGGLKFEPDAGIGQKGAFCKGLSSLASQQGANSFLPPEISVEENLAKQVRPD